MSIQLKVRTSEQGSSAPSPTTRKGPIQQIRSRRLSKRLHYRDIRPSN